MQNTKIKQFISGALAFTMLVSGTACNKDKEDNGTTNSGQTDILDSTSNVYSSTDLDLGSEISSVQALYYVDEKDFYYCYGSDSEFNQMIYKIDSDLTNPELFLNLSSDGSNSIYDPSILNNGNIAIITQLTTYGDLPPIDYSDPTMNWDEIDWEAYEEVREDFYNVIVYDETGAEIKNISLDSEMFDSETYISAIKYLNNDKIIIVDDQTNVRVFDDEGQSIGEILVDDLQYIDTMIVTKDNTVLCSGYGEDSYCVSEVDADNLSVIETYDLEELGYSSGINAGYDNYKFTVNSTEGLLGFNSENKELEEIINWSNSDISNVNINFIIPTKDSEFIAGIAQDDFRGELTLSKFTKRDPSEIVEKEIVTIATLYGSYNLNDYIATFNQANNEYKIKVVDYSTYNTEENNYTGATKQLKNDILSGNAPDILTFGTEFDYTSLAKKGFFEDLYSYIDKDEELDREDYIQSILSLYEYDDKLIMYSPSFSMQTLVGKTEHVGDKENWSVDDLISAYENRPDGMELWESNYKTTALYSLFYSQLNDIVNAQTGEVNINTPENERLLEFINQFEDEPDWKNMTDDNMRDMAEMAPDDYMMAMRNDKYLLNNAYISNLRDIHALIAGTFGDEDVTFVGTPSANGKGALITPSDAFYVISSTSSNKDVAWEFIRQFFTEEYQDTLEYAIPTNLNSFEKAAEIAKLPYSWTDPETGEVISYPTTFWNGTEEIEIGDTTQEEIDRFLAYIDSSAVLGNQDIEIYMIFQEEFQPFLEGTTSAKDTLSMIQSRVSLYVSEQG